MTRAALVPVLLAAAGAIAAPVPPQSERDRITAAWGKPFARSEKYGFELDGRFLTLRTAGEPIVRPSFRKPPAIPRTHRPVRGDFVATVRLVTAAPPDPKADFVDGAPLSQAGLIVSGGVWEVNLHLRQHHALNPNQTANETPIRELFGYVWNEGHGRGRPYGRADLQKPLYFRIARTDKIVTAAHSTDGATWTNADLPMEPELPDEVTVGVYFCHSTHQTATATFSDFTIEKPPAPK